MYLQKFSLQLYSNFNPPHKNRYYYYIIIKNIVNHFKMANDHYLYSNQRYETHLYNRLKLHNILLFELIIYTIFYFIIDKPTKIKYILIGDYKHG